MTHPIVACARGWIGTRFHHQGRLRKTAAHAGGVDCLGLLVGVADELQLRGINNELLSKLDERDYSHQPDADRLRCILKRYLEPVNPEMVRAGDIVLLRIGGRAQHLAIISDTSRGLGIIHAYAPARAVVEHALDENWRKKITAIFRV